MRYAYFLLIVFLLVCGSKVETAVGRWSTSGPYAGYGTIFFDKYENNVVYSAAGSLFRSTNMGRSWTEFQTPGGFDLIVPDPTIRNELVGIALPIGSSTLFVYRSHDAGSSWQFVSQTLLTPFYFYSSLSDFEFGRSGSVLFASVVGIGLFSSHDGGQSWERKTSGLPPAREYNAVIEVDPGNSKLMYMLLSNRKTRKVSFLRSLNAGESWQQRGHGLDLLSGHLNLEIDPRRPEIIYAASRRLFKSINRGENWFNVPFSTGDNATVTEIDSITIDQENSNNIYLISNFKALQSTDGGIKWKAMKFPFFFEPTFQIAVHPRLNRIIFAAGPDFLRSEDYGKNWKIANFGINTGANWLQSSIREPARFFAGGLNVYQSRDSGSHWKVFFRPTKTFKQPTDMAIHPNNSTIMAFRANNDLEGTYNLALSRNGGGTWNFSNAPPGNVVFHPNDQNIIYVASAKSTDFGKKWQNFKFGPVQVASIIQMDARNPSSLYTLVKNDIYQTYAVYHTADGGASWKRLSRLDRLIKPVYDFQLSPSNSRVMYASGVGGFAISTDGGVQWSKRNNGLSYLPNVTILTVDPSDEKKLYSVDYGRLYFTTDSGQNWHLFDQTGLPQGTLRAVAVDPSNPKTLLVANNKGVFSYTFPTP